MFNLLDGTKSCLDTFRYTGLQLLQKTAWKDFEINQKDLLPDFLCIITLQCVLHNIIFVLNPKSSITQNYQKMRQILGLSLIWNV